MARPTIWSEERATLYQQQGYWTDDSYTGYLKHNAERMPDGPALSDDRQSLTWVEVDRWTDAVACSLIRRGLPRDAVLATWLPNWIENYLLRLACEKAGLLWLPVPRSARPHELRPILETAKAAGVVVAAGQSRDYWADLQEIRPALPSLEWAFLARGNGNPEVPTLEHLAAEAPSHRELAQLAVRSFQTDEVAMLQPTSGSTGVPKLCEYLLAGCTVRGRAQVELFGLGSRDVLLATVQGFGPSIPPLLAAPVVAAEVVVVDHGDPGQVLRLIERKRVSVAFAVPPIYRELVPLLEQRLADVSSVRIWYSTGMRMPADLAETLERLSAGVVVSGYGGVDLGCWAAPAPDDPQEVRWLTAGRPRGGTELRLVGAERGSAAETDGEVWGRGPSSVTGYFRQPDLTRQAWTDDGWFRTGDIGRFDECGNLLLVGRKVEAINRGGQKIFPAELEHLLELHPQIARVAVLGIRDEHLGERVCACVVPRDGSRITLQDIVGFLRQYSLASYKLPERLEVMSRLPITSGGKLARGALRAELASKLRVNSCQPRPVHGTRVMAPDSGV